MKSFLALLLAVLTISMLGGCAKLTEPANSPPADPIPDALAASVVLYDRTEDLICAGTRVSPTKIVTAFHCVAAVLEPEAESDDLTLRDRFTGESILYSTYAQVMAAGYDGTTKGQFAQVGAVDIIHDLAVLETKPSTQTFVGVNGDELRVGAPIFVLGHPAGLTFTYARGYVSNICRYGDTFRMCWTQLDVSVFGGSSGGGVFNEQGELIGVTSRRVLTTYSFVAPPYAVASLVN